MEVTAQAIAALRALLSGNPSELQRLVGGFRSRDDKVAYSALIHTAFLEAANRRFTAQGQRSEVIKYVADVRARFDEVADAVDPRAAERIILDALGQGTTDGIDSRTGATATFFLLAALIADERLDDAALEQVIAKATALANQVLNCGPEPDSS